MRKEEIKRIYSRYSSIYDRILSGLFSPRIKLGLEKLDIKKGERIIEVGVGTGLSLPLYPPFCKVVGIDLTRKMLEQARQKKNEHGFQNVDLCEMDAENLAFADNSFDHAIVPFVLSVVPDPEKMISEAKRVTKNGGRIVIINHFASNNRLFSAIEGALSPFFQKLGWRAGPTLQLLSNHCSLPIDGVTKLGRFDLWLIVNTTNRK